MTATMNGKPKNASAIGPDVTNGAKQTLDHSIPYRVELSICGDADLLFHRWNCEAVEAKAKAAKGSAAKKTDDVESYVYRNNDNELCIPGEYLRQAIIAAAKYRQDPRSPRKSAMDLVKAAVVSLTPLASLGIEDWDYEHRCRVQVQRSGVTRVRPAINAGWTATFLLMVNLPEYVSSGMLHGLVSDAGRLIGIADFRPTYGRFRVTRFDVLDD
ncbi:hypothetical protein [Thalassoglobus polymorphus]|uniref:Uncharacterized protein n=1 Tax=Thalassoglobus polymorphus TaxID=2527994 RepID=A0A517QQX4_9PLAN|nr:hypothetical protein [Thalassoglobus polymorphus]QDT34008.1 hypothetical protein Mal48_32650 [Thalassoglobus polymorphus]